MKKNKLKPLLLVGCLLMITCAAIVYASRGNQFSLWPPLTTTAKNGVVTLTGTLTQDKVLYGGDGIAALSLSMIADEILDLEKGDANHVDMVIVLDRSGSMNGEKIADARQAALNLLSSLSAGDRFGLVTYSNSVRRHTNLINVTRTNRQRLKTIINRISTGGATNLGAGLQEGINVLQSARQNGNVRKIILISDGLANRGIMDPASLGNMASVAVEKEFGVSTVGVGTSFNEHLMTHIADRGAGNYYYLEDPSSFAAVFHKEFNNTRAAVATAVEVRIPLKDGISVVNASGYPVEVKNNQAIIHPGDLLSGQTRKLFLTLRVPTHKEHSFELAGINTRYRYEGKPYTVTLSDSFQIACVRDQKEVFSSIDKSEWEEKVLKEDYNKLREEVAADIKAGKPQAALKRIQNYSGEQQAVNSVVGSGKVAANLEKDVETLRDMVNETFQGSAPEVEMKQKKNSKALQYEGYRGRRFGK
ncbi:MAG: VWA domain-containing protein [Deltaproteobacteria bacterium]|nr:MAG: VWA domain-containing protein [Deltaproteobacteria bacterium]